MQVIDERGKVRLDHTSDVFSFVMNQMLHYREKHPFHNGAPPMYGILIIERSREAYP